MTTEPGLFNLARNLVLGSIYAFSAIFFSITILGVLVFGINDTESPDTVAEASPNTSDSEAEQAAENEVSDTDADTTAEKSEQEDEAEALRQEHEDDLEEARAKIDNLEGLAQRADSQNQDRLARNYRERAASLKAEFDLEDDDEPGRYDVEALVDTGDESEDDEAAEALQEFREKKEQREADENLPDEAKAQLSMLKQMRSQASTDAIREVYQGKIDDLREEHVE